MNIWDDVQGAVMPYLKGFAHKEININFEKCVNDHKYSSEMKAAVISIIA